MDNSLAFLSMGENPARPRLITAGLLLLMGCLPGCRTAAPLVGRDACAPPVGALPLDLHAPRRDPNGLPFGPIFVAQDRGPRVEGRYCRPDPEALCGGFPTDAPKVEEGRPRCNSSATADLPTGFHAFMCSLERFKDGRKGKLRAHVNFVPATYEGFLDWNSLSTRPPFGDGDVTMELEPVEQTALNRYAAKRAGLTAYPAAGIPSFHIEWKASELSDHFEQGFWKSFREGAEGRRNPALDALPTTRLAVVTGLVGLDVEHVGHSELHPVYALALQTRCATQEGAGTFSERWALALRNWGNEGYCSSYRCLHHLLLDEKGTFSLRLPLGNVAEVRDLRLGEGTGETELWASHPEVEMGAAVDLDPDGSAALVRFRLPDPAVGSLLYGEFTLRFEAQGEAGCASRPAEVASGTAVGPAAIPRAAEREVQQPEEEEGAEGLLQELGKSAPLELTRSATAVLEPFRALRFEKLVPAGRITPVGSAQVEDRLECPVSRAATPQEAEAERAAVCEAARRMSPEKTRRDRRLKELLRECARTP